MRLSTIKLVELHEEIQDTKDVIKPENSTTHPQEASAPSPHRPRSSTRSSLNVTTAINAFLVEANLLHTWIKNQKMPEKL
jgi:hypothetical protein